MVATSRPVKLVFEVGFFLSGIKLKTSADACDHCGVMWLSILVGHMCYVARFALGMPTKKSCVMTRAYYVIKTC